MYICMYIYIYRYIYIYIHEFIHIHGPAFQASPPRQWSWVSHSTVRLPPWWGGGGVILSPMYRIYSVYR